MLAFYLFLYQAIGDSSRLDFKTKGSVWKVSEFDNEFDVKSLEISIMVEDEQS